MSLIFLFSYAGELDRTGLKFDRAGLQPFSSWGFRSWPFGPGWYEVGPLALKPFGPENSKDFSSLPSRNGNEKKAHPVHQDISAIDNLVLEYTYPKEPIRRLAVPGAPIS